MAEDKKLERIKKRKAKKAARQDKRAKRIEARKGLAAGEGKKLLDNRKQRRKEFWNEEEVTTKKYSPKSSQEAAGQKMAQMGFDAKADEADFKVKQDTQKIKNSVSTKPTWSTMYGSGGGFDMSSPVTDRTDMSSNASGLYRKKKGYNW